MRRKGIIMNSETREIVYVLANKAMPNLIKIGKTKRKDLQERMRELYSTGVPFPFECLWAGEVEDCTRIEGIIHNAFRHNRVNPKREFFNIQPDQVIPLLQELSINELTETVEEALSTDVTQEEKQAVKQYHRPPLDFEEMGIPVGSVLVYTKDPSVTAKVVSNKKVLYNDKEFSLSPLTKTLLEVPYYVAPGRYWTYEGKSLADIYDETYVAEDE